MKIYNVLLKIAYWLVALSIVVLIGLTFYARRVITQQSQPAPVKSTAVVEEESTVKISGMTLTFDSKKPKKEVTENKEVIEKDESNQTDKP